MSTSKNTERLNIKKMTRMAEQGEKLTMLTAYDATMAAIVDAAGVDMILVGDSLGMVVQGHATTIPVTVEQMVYHTECVARGSKRAMIITDMPFLSYQVSHDAAINHCGSMIRAGAQALKLEGGEEIADLVWYLSKIGIPAMAHIGLKPQHIHMTGGFRVQGKSREEADAILDDALILEEAGAFALLLEAIPMELAAKITESVSIPTIGIGSGPACRGQVLVVNDILGLNPDFAPSFIKRYGEFYSPMVEACKKFHDEVRSQKFPADEHGMTRGLKIVPGGMEQASTPTELRKGRKPKTDK
jgi:3-methyl-2-oxobutanoate hydroxymethyltransferase